MGAPVGGDPAHAQARLTSRSCCTVGSISTRNRVRSLVRSGQADADLDRELRSAHRTSRKRKSWRVACTRDEAHRTARSARSVASSASARNRGTRVVSRCSRTSRVTFVMHSADSVREPMLLVAATISIARRRWRQPRGLQPRARVHVRPARRARPEELVQFQVSHGSHASYQKLARPRRQRRARRDRRLLGREGAQLAQRRRGDVDHPDARHGELLRCHRRARGARATVHGRRGARGRRAPHDLVSHAFWQSRLGGDSAVIGRPIMLNGESYTILGVLAPKLRSVAGFSISPAVYAPLSRSLVPELPDATRTSSGCWVD